MRQQNPAGCRKSAINSLGLGVQRRTGHEVLTLHRDYFRLRKPLERRMYELARKHCGKQDEWSISLELLRKKCGSASRTRNSGGWSARFATRMPSTAICRITPSRRRRQCAVHQPQHHEAPPLPRARIFPVLDPETYNEARIVRPATTFTTWKNNGGILGDSGKPELKNPDAAFIGFCKSRHNRRPNP